MASWWQKAAIAIASFVGLTGSTYFVITRRPVPGKKGQVSLAGLHEPVEIITDRYGVPHIYAENEDDLFFGQGYVHASERLWQMDLNRRIGSGRLSEIFGEAGLEPDRFARRLGMHRAAAAAVMQLTPHSRRILDAYTHGVNAYIEGHRRNLPLEFLLLRYQPDPWKIADSVQWSKMMGWNLGGNWETELIRARLVARLGVERAAKLEAGYDPRHPLIVPPGVEYQGINLGMLEQYEQLKQLSGFGLLGGSNNWVVDGSMTVTGAPILCNDPHLGQTAPSIWFECHLVAGDIDVAGVSFPGAPGIVIGHNQYVAWGFTNAISDVEDLYIEKFNPDNPNQYEYMGTWEEAQVIREEIIVKGSDTPVIEEVRITRHGPIIATYTPPSSPPTHVTGQASNNGRAPADINEPRELPLALRWTGLEKHDVMTAVSQMNRATNWQEFRDGLRYWDVPPQNAVFADIQGNIGYVMAGAIPIRKQGQALLPSPGWTDEYEWIGYIPFEELPQTINPEQHFIATANNRVIDDAYPYYITNEWLNGYRAQRIRDLLTSKGKLSLSDMAAIQADQYALPAVEIVPHLLELRPATPTEQDALDILRAWDYVMSADSAGAAIYSATLWHLERIVFSAILGNDELLLQSYLGVGSTILMPQNSYASRDKPLLIRLLNERDDNWFAGSAIPNGPRSWDAALHSAFHAAIAYLHGRLGDNVSRWKYGAIHKMTYNHPLGMRKPLDRIFNRGPYPVGGDIDTVNMGASPVNQPETVITVPSYRQIVDLADLKASLSMHHPGQSGHPASKHYDDFIKPWLNVEYHPMLFDREMIEENAAGVLHLAPKK
jgi:penicillin amidase